MPTLSTRAVLPPLLALLLSACPASPPPGGGEPTNVPPAPDAGPGVAYTVPAAGGTLQVPTSLGAVAFAFPASAGGKALRFTEVTAAGVGLDAAVRGVLRMEPAGTTFSEPVRVQLPGNVGLAVSLPDSGALSGAEPLAYDAASGTFALHHFSLLAWVDRAAVLSAVEAQCGASGGLSATPAAPVCSARAPATERLEGSCAVQLPLGCYAVSAACCVEPGGHACAAGSASFEGAFVATTSCGQAPPADAAAPIVVITSPADGLETSQALISVAGSATDNVRLVQLSYTLDGVTHTALPLTAGATEASFSFEAALVLGNNVVSVEARDAAGNAHTALVNVLRVEPAVDAPSISRFSADKQGVEPGETVVLSWEVTGAQTLTLEPEGQDVSGLTQLAVQAPADDTVYTLVASNDGGTTRLELLLGVGGPLRFFPQSAVIVPGAKQRFVAENGATYGRWSVSEGGQLSVESVYGAPELQYQQGVFSAATPGLYTLTYTTDERVPRTGSFTIEVRAIASRLARFEGLGGQLMPAFFEPGRGMAVDGSGALWAVPSSESGALGRLDPITQRWGFVRTYGAGGERGSPEQVVAAMGGDVYVVLSSSQQLLRVPAGSLVPEAISTPWLSAYRVRLHADPQGGLWAWALMPSPDFSTSAPALFHRAQGAAQWETLTPPAGMEITALGVSPAGVLYAGGYDTADSTVDVLTRGSDGSWSSTGLRAQTLAENSVLPRNLPLHAFAFSGESLYAASWGVMLYTPGTSWSALTLGLPSCQNLPACEVFDVAVEPDGELLAATYASGGSNLAGIYVRPTGQSSFEPRALPSSFSVHSLGYAFRNVEVTAQGEVFAGAQERGVFRLGATDERWQQTGVPGMPTSENRIQGLAVAPDGTLVVAAGISNYGGEHHSLYRMAPGEAGWTGFGAELGSDDYGSPWLVSDVAFDGAGNLTLVTGEGQPYAQAGQLWRAAAGAPLTLAPLSGPGGFVSQVEATPEGALYVHSNSAEGAVWRLDAGASSWSGVPALAGMKKLVQAEDGAQWALHDSRAGVYRLLPTGPGWERISDGLGGFWSSITQVLDLARAADGGVLAATDTGVYRFAPGASRWEALGFGYPGLGALRVSSAGGRTYALGLLDGVQAEVYELDAATGAWVPAPTEGLPRDLHHGWGFEALPDGRLVLHLSALNGLMRSVDAP